MSILIITDKEIRNDKQEIDACTVTGILFDVKETISNANDVSVENRLPIAIEKISKFTSTKYVVMPTELAKKLLNNYFNK
ncbi:MAG: hypothetical protein ABH887_01270 [bacterium]